MTGVADRCKSHWRHYLRSRQRKILWTEALLSLASVSIFAFFGYASKTLLQLIIKWLFQLKSDRLKPFISSAAFFSAISPIWSNLTRPLQAIAASWKAQRSRLRAPQCLARPLPGWFPKCGFCKMLSLAFTHFPSAFLPTAPLSLPSAFNTLPSLPWRRPLPMAQACRRKP